MVLPNPPHECRSRTEPIKSAYGVPSDRLLTEPARLLVLAATGLGREADDRKVSILRGSGSRDKHVEALA